MEINWQAPQYGGNACFMSLCWGMAVQQTLVEGNMKKYFPFQYKMMKNFQAAYAV